MRGAFPQTSQTLPLAILAAVLLALPAAADNVLYFGPGGSMLLTPPSEAGSTPMAEASPPVAGRANGEWSYTLTVPADVVADEATVWVKGDAVVPPGDAVGVNDVTLNACPFQLIITDDQTGWYICDASLGGTELTSEPQKLTFQWSESVAFPAASKLYFRVSSSATGGTIEIVHGPEHQSSFSLKGTSEPVPGQATTTTNTTTSTGTTSTTTSATTTSTAPSTTTTTSAAPTTAASSTTARSATSTSATPTKESPVPFLVALAALGAVLAVRRRLD